MVTDKQMQAALIDTDIKESNLKETDWLHYIAIRIYVTMVTQHLKLNTQDYSEEYQAYVYDRYSIEAYRIARIFLLRKNY